MKLLRILFFPFSLLYGVVMALRNILFAWGVLRSESFDVPLISIGNITVGGTGKTPHTEYLINLLKGHSKLAVLSRGYGRHTKGFREVTERSTPELCGDEPCQMKRKFPEQLVLVDENRREGIHQILNMARPHVVLLDDAYQHRWVKPGLSILLVDYSRPIFIDFMMPTGHLREFPVGSRRADVIIVSKCPADISEQKKAYFTDQLRIGKHQKIYFSTYVYDELKMVFPNIPMRDFDCNHSEILLLTGIANPQPLEDYLRQLGANVSAVRFSDHYQFTNKDIERLEQQFEALKSSNCRIITTEKDAIRLRSGLAIPTVIKENLLYLPIVVSVLDKKEELHQIIENYVAKN